jgi:site-specific recombinase XerD
MKGARPLTAPEVHQVSNSFRGRYALRDRALFVLGIKTGLRISELFCLAVGDVLQHEQIVDRVHVQRKHMKRKTEGRTILLHPEAKEALALWVAQLSEWIEVRRDTPVFLFRKRQRTIGRRQAWTILMGRYAENQLGGTLGTHAMRKTFANKVHVLLGRDLVKTQRALGHKNVSSTVSYLSFPEEEIDEAILAL